MKKICLWSFNGLGLIIKYPSGVIYTNQAGGYACLQPQEEGILSILETEEPQQKKTFHQLRKFTLNLVRLTEKEADWIDDLLKKDSFTSFLSVDQSMLHQSMEAWIYINIEEQPENFDVSNIPFYEFEKIKGVITWYNSD